MSVKRWHADLALVGGRLQQDVLITADGERLTGVEPGHPLAPAGATHLPGLTLPGLVNAHSHVFHRALRGRTHEVGDFWSWREAMYRIAARLDPDSLRLLARAVYAEMALAGITAVGEFHYVHHQPDGTPYPTANAMGRALIDGAGDAGVRLTLLDTCYLQAGIDGAPVSHAQRRFSDQTADGWAARVDDLDDEPAVRIGAAIHSVRAVDRKAMESVAGYARDRGMPLHLHLSEQPAENDACQAATGMTPAALADATGILGPSTTAVHATHVDDEDVARLGRTGTAVCLCPTTERDLADGIGPAAAFVAARSPLCLGSDSHAVIDLFEEARAVELDERLRSGRRGVLAPAALLDAATAGGAAALGWEAGMLAPGLLADFVTIDLDGPHLAGFDVEHGAAHVVFGASATDVHHVVVGGVDVVDAGRHLQVRDVADELRTAFELVQ
jgi:formiminoglutamate deiminase